ncbi:hypothetical protein EX30DRAFT_250161 [Ascodesmis nigricans]|uniref:Uncharacterized protein n=1 Tax=Ascodesmis nigricans TaxID=341454 RepID=A0A4S2MYB7_9PEZI|nr:hypothetical protein EX30DRAFT_250161 [Ascodesmis nigricans]
MSSPYTYHSHQNALPPASHRGISPALSTRSGTGGSSYVGAPSHSGYNPAMYQGGRLRRTSNSPMRDMDVGGGASSQYNPQEYGPVSGNSGAFVPSRPGESDLAPPPPYSPPVNQTSSASSAQAPLPQRDHRNPGLQILTPPHRRDPSIPQTARLYTSGHAPPSAGEPGWRTGYTPTSAPVMRTTFNDPAPPSATRENSLPRSVPPPPPGPPPASSRSGSVSATPERSIPPPPPGPPPRERSTSRSGRRSADGGLTLQTTQPMSLETIHSAGGTPPVPPKRKMMEEEGSYREHHRSSPKQKEEEGPRRSGELEGGGNNNPWRNGTSARVSPPREFPKAPAPPLIDLTSAHIQPSSMFARRATTPRPPTLDTGMQNGAQQLPTPPPQQLSPTMSPDGMSDHVFSPAPGPGPSKGKEPVEIAQGFLETSKRRYREALAAEDVAITEEDKLRLFLAFLTKECQTRLDLYTDTVNTAEHRKLAKITAILTGAPNSEHSLTPVSPVNIGDIDDEDMGSPRSRQKRETNWWSQNSTSLEQRIRDEESSRGRTSSRWWETSHGSVSESMAYRSDGMPDDDMSLGFGRRSKKRSKKPRASLREIAETMNTPRNPAQGPNPSNPASYMGSAAYPPDRKTQSRSRSRPAHSRTRAASKRPVKLNLDIAPLLTLLPPYPKDYPAVNNSHPSLEIFRNLVRTLNQLDSLKTLHETFTQWQQQHNAQFQSSATKRRNQQAERIQSVYASSRRTIDYAAIEKLNIAFESSELQHRTQHLQQEFDHFSATVVDPAHRDLHDRITAATAAYNDLSAIIDSPAPTSSDPDSDPGPPELHEQLTALKWLFEVREQLHTHIFDLLSQRNTMYKTLVITPLPDPRAAEAFFAKDSSTRSTEHHNARNQRHAQFTAFVETQVTKGVEIARSAYWDIAPLVQESLLKIPEQLGNVVPIVPPEEGHQNPELLKDPMLYLQRKLGLARDAMYRSVEAQTELLCLLHEVKSRGEVEEERLDRDLKEKVGMVEEEWKEGLGVVFEAVRRRVDEEIARRGEAGKGV